MKKILILSAVALALSGATLVVLNSKSRTSGAIESELVRIPQQSTTMQEGTLARPLPVVSASDVTSRLQNELSPAQAFAAAHVIVACSTAIETLPPSGLSPEEAKVQQKEFLSNLQCENIDTKHSIYDLAKYAAEHGDQQAKTDFPALAAFAFNDEAAASNPELIRDYKESSRRFLEQAAKLGSQDALQKLSESFDSGRFTPKNPKLAYAYALAYAQKTGSRIAHKRATNLAMAISTVEIAEAQNIANKL